MRAYLITVPWGKGFVEVDTKGTVTHTTNNIFKKFLGKPFHELNVWAVNLKGIIVPITEEPKT